MKNIFLIVFCLLVSTVWAKEEKNKRIQYCTTLEEAMQQAARKHKPIFFNCYAGWAGPSVLMDSVVLTDPDLVSSVYVWICPKPKRDANWQNVTG